MRCRRRRTCCALLSTPFCPLLSPLPCAPPCSTSALQTLLALLNHENSDVAADAVEVLQELTDSDAVEDAVNAVLAVLCCAVLSWRGGEW